MDEIIFSSQLNISKYHLTDKSYIRKEYTKKIDTNKVLVFDN